MAFGALDGLLARDVVPDSVLRAVCSAGVGARLRRSQRGDAADRLARRASVVARSSTGPIAEATEDANEQHYELPEAFLGLQLGPRRKYSSCWWGDGVETLEEAEEAMLDLSCRRAGITDGMRVLDLGCGWGSMTLFVAQRCPGCEVLGVSNSHGQRRWIEAEARRRGLDNVRVVTADVNDFVPDGRFDRIVSIEMFEHMRNWRKLLRRVSAWLEDDGRLFVHVFSHREEPYVFDGTWMAERFFTAGLMPSHDLLPEVAAGSFEVEADWELDGRHYQRTLEAWLARLDARRDEAERLIGADRVPSWRLFLMGSSALWGADEGRAWRVSHYRLRPIR